MAGRLCTGLHDDLVGARFCVQGFHQGQFEKIADRDPDEGFSPPGKNEFFNIVTLGAIGIPLVGQKVISKDFFGLSAQQGPRKPDPAIFPYPFLLIA